AARGGAVRTGASRGGGGGSGGGTSGAEPHPAEVEGSLSVALTRLREAGLSSRQVIGLLERARVEPVLTAHPTEVQRKSILDRHHAIAAHLAIAGADHASALAGAGDAPVGRGGGRAVADAELALRREILILWKTDELRVAKPTVIDEVD